jgi:hypothetical protein
MSLNYEFINNVDPLVKAEIQRRENVYWPSGHIDNEALTWNYQKTAYLTMRAVNVKKIYEQEGSNLPNSPSTSTQNAVQGKTLDWRKSTLEETLANFDYNDAERTQIGEEVTVISTMINPSAPILDLYNDKGTIKGAVINSAEISSDGTYGSILRTTVNFTVFDRFELDRYIDNFLRPGRDIELEYGWTVNDNIKQNHGKIRGTVYNFNFSAKADGSWDCTLNALGPSSMTYGFGLDQQGTNKPDADWIDSPKGKTLAEVFKTIIDTTDKDEASDVIVTGNCKKRSIATSYHILKPTSTINNTGFNEIYSYTYKLPLARELTISGIFNVIGAYYTGFIYGISGMGKAAASNNKNSKIDDTLVSTPYMSLRDLINLINLTIVNSTKISIPLYTFNAFNKAGSILEEEVCNAELNEYLKGVGPSNLSKFVFSTQINGANSPRLDFNIGESFTPPIKRGGLTTCQLPDLILFNVNYLYSTIQNILSNDTNLTGKKIVTFLSNIFNELNTNTGGWISLVIKDSPIDPNTHRSEYLSIRNENYTPSTIKLDDPLVFKAFTKGSVVRNLSVEASVPDAIQAEVATYTRAGQSYVGSGDSTAEADASLLELRTSLFNLNNSFMDNINNDEQKMQSSLSKWQNEVQGIYRKMFAITQGQTLAGNIVSKYNIGNLGTAIFPIKLKVTLDGIEGFQYGNSVTSNWLPKQYIDADRKKKIYWTVIKIRHRIENNDWSTELDTIYRVNT